MQDSNVAASECLYEEHKTVKMEIMDAVDGDTTAADCEMSEDETNLCKMCSKICYLKDLNEELICNECSCPAENIIKMEETTLKGNTEGMHDLESYPKPKIELCDEVVIEQEIITEHSLLDEQNSAEVDNVTADDDELQEPQRDIDMFIKKLGNLNFICIMCPATRIQKYKYPSTVRKHIRMTHFGYRYECTECNKTTTALKNMKLHYAQTHHMEAPEKIEITKPTSVDNNILMAIKNSYKKIKTYFICTICGESSKKYSNSNTVRRHVKLTHFGCYYECTLCKAKFKISATMRNHYRNVHGKMWPFNLRLKIGRSNRAGNFNETETKVTTSNCSSFIQIAPGIGKEADHYICTLCTEGSSPKYKAQRYVRNHIRYNHMAFRYKCTMCNVKYADSKRLRLHYRKQHNRDPPLKRHITKDQRLLMKTNDKQPDYTKVVRKLGNKYICTICPKSEMRNFNHSRGAIYHIKTIHYGYRFNCSKCDTKYVNQASMQKHYKDVHNMEGAIKIVLKKSLKFQVKSNELIEEDGVKKEPSIVSVGKLENSTAEKDTFNKEFIQIDNFYYCTLCSEFESQNYKTLRHVQRHIKIQHHGFRYECSECDCNYTNLGILRIHYSAKHNKEPPQTLDLTKPELNKTKTFEYGVRRIGSFFLCTLCPESKYQQYKDLDYVRRHIQITHNGYRYKCTVCGTKYSDKSNFRKHYRKKHNQQMPEGIEPIKCEADKKIDYDVDIEMKGENYYCKICSLSYKRIKNVRRHIEVKHYGFRFNCTMCDHYYAQSCVLKSHYATEHNVEPPKRINITKNFQRRTESEIADDVFVAVQRQLQAKSLNKNVEPVGDDNYKCKLCSRSYKSMNNCRQHIRRAHDSSQDFGIAKKRKKQRLKKQQTEKQKQIKRNTALVKSEPISSTSSAKFDDTTTSAEENDDDEIYVLPHRLRKQSNDISLPKNIKDEIDEEMRKQSNDISLPKNIKVEIDEEMRKQSNDISLPKNIKVEIDEEM